MPVYDRFRIRGDDRGAEAIDRSAARDGGGRPRSPAATARRDASPTCGAARGGSALAESGADRYEMARRGLFPGGGCHAKGAHGAHGDRHTRQHTQSRGTHGDRHTRRRPWGPPMGTGTVERAQWSVGTGTGTETRTDTDEHGPPTDRAAAGADGDRHVSRARFTARGDASPYRGRSCRGRARLGQRPVSSPRPVHPPPPSAA